MPRTVVQAAVFGILSVALSSCRPCTEGTKSEVVRYDQVLLTLVNNSNQVTKQHVYYCETDRTHSIAWTEVSVSDGYAYFNPGYYGEAYLSASGTKTHGVHAQALRDRSQSRYIISEVCYPNQPFTVHPHHVIYLDLDAVESLGGDVHRRYPVIKWRELDGLKQSRVLTAHDPLGSSTLPFPLSKHYAICLYSGGEAKAGAVYLADYQPVSECRATPPPSPAEPTPKVTCQQPRPTPPAAETTNSNTEATSCSAQAQDPSSRTFNVPFVFEASSCGGTLLVTARTEHDARICAADAIPEIKVVPRVCLYSLRLYSNAGTLTVERLSDSRDGARKCTESTDCSEDYGACEPDMIEEIDCTSGDNGIARDNQGCAVSTDCAAADVCSAGVCTRGTRRCRTGHDEDCGPGFSCTSNSCTR